jgi:phage N-6-adenine-methyltransferase
VTPEWWTSDEWSTPQAMVDAEVERGGPFDLDVCCRAETAKGPAYYTKADDGLTRQWFGRVWCNPPYSNPKAWIKRAIEATSTGEADEVVMLLPAAVDTRWFHDLVLPHADVRFVRGRVRFLGWEGTPIPAPKSGSMLVYLPMRKSQPR